MAQESLHDRPRDRSRRGDLLDRAPAEPGIALQPQRILRLVIVFALALIVISVLFVELYAAVVSPA
jgi:hypothetical protein